MKVSLELMLLYTWSFNELLKQKKVPLHGRRKYFFQAGANSVFSRGSHK